MGGFELLFFQSGDETVHLVRKGFGVIVNFFDADVAARRQHVVVRADVVQRGALAEAWHVGILACVLVTAPVAESAILLVPSEEPEADGICVE